ncbi:MAG: hypothetical protein Q8N05_08220 [Bacteroidota bacterium]|nr:hypothetical protein [Bacteroidota bacterium]
MATVIIDTRSNEAKRLVEYLKTIKYARVLDNKTDDNDAYDPEFVDKINTRKNQPSVKVDIKDLWK